MSDRNTFLLSYFNVTTVQKVKYKHVDHHVQGFNQQLVEKQQQFVNLQLSPNYQLGDVAAFCPLTWRSLLSSSGRLVHSKRYGQKLHACLTTIFSPFTCFLTVHRWLHFWQDLKSSRMHCSSTTNSDGLRETRYSR